MLKCKKILQSKFVLKLKRDSLGSIAKYNPHLLVCKTEFVANDEETFPR